MNRRRDPTRGPFLSRRGQGLVVFVAVSVLGWLGVCALFYHP